MHTVERIKILNLIGDCFQQIIQWRRGINPGWSTRVTEHLHKAEVLIELLEIEDCRSIGGYDEGQPGGSTIFDRWEWLYRKYDNPDGLKFGSGIVSFEEIKKYCLC